MRRAVWVDYGEELAGALCIGCAEDRTNWQYFDRRRRHDLGNDGGIM